MARRYPWGSDPGAVSDHAQFDADARECIDRAVQMLAAVRGADLGADARLALGYHRKKKKPIA